jgi:hypothetical protein
MVRLLAHAITISLPLGTRLLAIYAHSFDPGASRGSKIVWHLVPPPRLPKARRADRLPIAALGLRLGVGPPLTQLNSDENRLGVS